MLGSAGGPRHALPLLIDGSGAAGAADSFVIVNGDTLTDLRIRDLIDHHERAGARVTMALIPNPRPDIYGGVRVEDGWITGFTRPGTPERSYHFIGVQAVHAEALSTLEDGVPAESVNWLYPRLIRESPRAAGGVRRRRTVQRHRHPGRLLADVAGPRRARGRPSRQRREDRHPSIGVADSNRGLG